MRYDVYLDDEILHYQGDEKYIINNAVFSEKINQASTLEFDIFDTNPRFNDFVSGRNYIHIERNGVEIFFGRVMEVSINIEGVKHIYVRGILAEYYNTIPNALNSFNTINFGRWAMTTIQPIGFYPNHNPVSPSPASKPNLSLTIVGDYTAYASFFFIKRNTTTGKFQKTASYSGLNGTFVFDNPNIGILWETNPGGSQDVDILEVTNWKYTDEEPTADVYWTDCNTDITLEPGWSLYPNPSNYHITYYADVTQTLRQLNWICPSLFLENSGSRYVEVGNSTCVSESTKDYLTLLKEVYVEKSGIYIKITKGTGKHHYILETHTTISYGKISNQIIEKSRNLISFNMSENAENVFNAVVARGTIKRENQDDEVVTLEGTSQSAYHVYTGDRFCEKWDSISRYGRHEKYVEFDDIVSAEDLRRKAELWLDRNSYSDLTIDATAFDLSYLNDDIDSFEVGDKAVIKGDAFGVDDIYAFITEKTTYLNDLSKNQIRLGTVQKNYTDQMNNRLSTNNIL